MKSGWCHVTMKVILEGEEVDFDDLSDVTKEYIAQKIIDGYPSIAIFECDEEDD